eukprot:6604787-Pyramimonas_sp.AAC.2
MGQVMGMLPGFSNALMGQGREQASAANLKKYIALMDSMTTKELDNPDIALNLKMLSDPMRVKRIVKGCVRPPRPRATPPPQIFPSRSITSSHGAGAPLLPHP